MWDRAVEAFVNAHDMRMQHDALRLKVRQDVPKMCRACWIENKDNDATVFLKLAIFAYCGISQEERALTRIEAEEMLEDWRGRTKRQKEKSIQEEAEVVKKAAEKREAELSPAGIRTQPQRSGGEKMG